MKLLYSVFLSFIIFAFSFADIKLPDVIFPLEIIAEKHEVKERLEPPNFINIDYSTHLIKITLPPSYPLNIKPIFVEPPKENTFLGLPKEKALYNDIVDLYINGNFILAQEKANNFLNKYPKDKNVGVVLYILGFVNFQLKDYNSSFENFSKSCSIESYVKDEACLSAAVLSLIEADVKKAQEFLEKANLKNDNAIFLKTAVKILESGNLEPVKDIKCENLDISFVNYCKYLKLHYLSSENPSEFFQKYEDIEGYEKVLTLLKGFAYLNQNKFNEAKEIFQNYLKTYGRADFYSKYPIYGIMVADLKEGNIQDVEDNIGSLEIRDKKLAQALYIQIGNSYFEKHNFKTAFAYYQKALLTYNENKEILKKLIGITAYNLGMYDYSYNIFKTINEDRFFFYTAFSLLQQKNYSEAEFYLEKAYKNAADNNIKEEALKYLADIYYFNNEDTKLIASLRQIAKYDQDFTANMLGWYFFRKKMYKEAYDAFTDKYMKAVSAFNRGKLDLAMNIIKNDADRKSLFLKAYIYLRKVQLDDARKILKKLAEGDDEIAKEAGYLYGYSFFSNEEYKRAYEEFKKFAEKYKDEPFGRRALLRMADSLYNLGEEKQAKKIYSDFIEKYSGTKEAIDAAYLLTVLEAKESGGNPDIAKQIEIFISKYPDYPKIDLLKLQLAEVYFENGKLEDAVKLLKEIVNKNVPESSQALYKIGYYYYKTGNLDEAKKYFIHYILKYPQGELIIPVKQLLASIYEKEGQIDEAIALYKELPKTDETTYKLAMLYFKKGDYLDAKEKFEDLYNKYPKYKNDIAYYLGYIQLKNNNLDDAKRYFKEAVKGSDYNKVAESYYILGNIYEKEGNLDEALNNYINVIYLYSQAKDFVLKSRIKVAKILAKQDKRIEAACMIEPVKDDIENLDNDTKSFIMSLPKCIKN